MWVRSDLASPRPAAVGAAFFAFLGSAIGFAVAGGSLLAHGTENWGWQMAARYTARASFLLFILVYLARPIATALGAALGPRILAARRGLGLQFATAHFVHLGALVTYLIVSETPPSPLTALFGGLGFVVLAAMVLTANDSGRQRLGERAWQRLHVLGLHYLWFIFAFTYFGRIQRAPEMAEYWVLLAVALTLPVIRLAAGRGAARGRLA
ncbi:MAG: hypothetical protein GC199_05195 [Alphaproteobacteria bacterium]|nr:hypothetical protein [Alphaproteobacteria bacterium]